ncbi:amine-terminal domain cyclin (macronuclear) [Tetrahymena thermophila SB210]|uniref:Amine-terminal domain cyclin n=1 Tax=Tetrahymena thermophila (strain SB210) TaxID=312017 RepID=Q22EG1_TETTS|nr:amine-terminal domain cyclin [Tetrahymena thermophila SB210]EAR83691.1 amine-terminal domain cyclin [Tetrahymena thermophila SB210]|eukprot:XP_001031354.1 amine-terminal domain cyclin [Tetrahymena thermophila SB210]
MVDNFRFYTDMGNQDNQFDIDSSKENNDLFGMSGLLVSLCKQNNNLVPNQQERMDIQSRVGKDITNVLQNQMHNNLPIKKAISSNFQDEKNQINMQKSLQQIRAHNRTTSSILFVGNKGKKDGIQANTTQEQQQFQFNDQARAFSNKPVYNNNVKVNKSGNFAQITSNYHQMNRIPEQFSCEKENTNSYAAQFHLQQQSNQIQNMQCQTNFLAHSTNNLQYNNFNNKSNPHLNIFASQAVSTSLNQPLSTITDLPLVQPIQNEEENEKCVSGTDSQQLNSSNKLAHLEYIREIISHLRATENNFSAKGGYMGVVQKEINERMRSILLDWLVDVHFKFKLRTETLFITINLIDRYLEQVPLESSRLQLLGITSLFIAAKYEEVYSVPHISDLVYVCDNAYKKEEIFDMEGSILKVLNFNILCVTSFRFLDYFIQFDELGEKNYYLARYLIEIALLEYKMISNAPSLLASAAIYLVNKIRKRDVAWKESMIEITGYLEQDIRPCAKLICHIVQTIDQRKYLVSLRKKFQKPQFLEVAKIKIEQRKENNAFCKNQIKNNNNGNCIQASQNLTSSVCAPFQECASKDQEIIPEIQNDNSSNNFNNPNNYQQQNQPAYSYNNFQNYHSNSNNNIQNDQCNINLQEQQLQQVQSVDITVPLQAACVLIEKRFAEIKPSNYVQCLINKALQGTQPIELKVPSQMLLFMIEKKIKNIQNKTLLWQLPIRLVKIVTNSMFNPENIEDLGLIPTEFVNFMIETIYNEQQILQQNSQRQYFSNHHHNTTTSNSNNVANSNTVVFQNFFNN